MTQRVMPYMLPWEIHSKPNYTNPETGVSLWATEFVHVRYSPKDDTVQLVTCDPDSAYAIEDNNMRELDDTIMRLIAARVSIAQARLARQETAAS